MEPWDFAFRQSAAKIAEICKLSNFSPKELEPGQTSHCFIEQVVWPPKVKPQETAFLLFVRENPKGHYSNALFMQQTLGKIKVPFVGDAGIAYQLKNRAA